MLEVLNLLKSRQKRLSEEEFKKNDDQQHRILIAKIILYHYFVEGVHSGLNTHEWRIKLSEGAYVYVTSGHEKSVLTRTDYCFKCDVKINNYLIFTTNFIIYDRLYPHIIEIYPPKINYETLKDEKTKVPETTHLKEFIEHVSIIEEKYSAIYDMPEWFKKDLQIDWAEIEAMLDDQYVHREIQEKLNNHCFDSENILDKKRVCLLISKILDEKLTDEEKDSIENISPQVQKHCYILLEDILKSLNYQMPETELETLFQDSIKKLEKRNTHG